MGVQLASDMTRPLLLRVCHSQEVVAEVEAEKSNVPAPTPTKQKVSRQAPEKTKVSSERARESVCERSLFVTKW